MKITIIGGGNMGGAIACGLALGKSIAATDITVADILQDNLDVIKKTNKDINVALNNYTSIEDADIIIFAVKPWLMEEIVAMHKKSITDSKIVISIASGISLDQLSKWTQANTPIYRIIPNTAIAVKESMSFISSRSASKDQDNLILSIFNELGKSMLIAEKLMPAATALSSCGIAFAFRYIRASMVGGVEMGIYPDQGKQILIQTLRGAIELLEANDSHPEAEIDKVTTPGGNTIKGLNEMEHAGFSSAVIKGLLASYNDMCK